MITSHYKIDYFEEQTMHYPPFEHIRSFICALLASAPFRIETTQRTTEAAFYALILCTEPWWALDLVRVLCESRLFIINHEIVKVALRKAPTLVLDTLLPCLAYPMTLNHVFALCIFPTVDEEIHFALVRRLLATPEYIMRFLDSERMNMAAHERLIAFLALEYKIAYISPWRTNP